jgi:hypothetical protein
MCSGSNSAVFPSSAHKPSGKSASETCSVVFKYVRQPSHHQFVLSDRHIPHSTSYILRPIDAIHTTRQVLLVQFLSPRRSKRVRCAADRWQGCQGNPENSKALLSKSCIRKYLCITYQEEWSLLNSLVPIEAWGPKKVNPINT